MMRSCPLVSIPALRMAMESKTTKSVFSKEEGPRADTSSRPGEVEGRCFHVTGTVTRGFLRHQWWGLLAHVVMSAAKARELGLKPMARFVGVCCWRRKPRSSVSPCR